METAMGFWLRTALLLLAVINSALPQSIRRHFAVGDSLTLTPPLSGEIINSIIWKYESDLVAEWVRGLVNLTYYDNYKGRAVLDTTTGRLEIRKMEKSEKGIYSVEINGKIKDESYQAEAIGKVPQPEVWIQPVACSTAMDECTLNCEGNTTGVGPVTYSWKEDEGEWEQSGKEIKITKMRTADVKTFSCQMKNPVSEKESIPKPNPLFTKKVPDNHVVKWVLSILAILAILVIIVVGVIKKDLICSKISPLLCFKAEDRASSEAGPPPASTEDATEISSLNPPKDEAPLEEKDALSPA